jgi:hypothetical protein
MDAVSIASAQAVALSGLWTQNFIEFLSIGETKAFLKLMNLSDEYDKFVTCLTKLWSIRNAPFRLLSRKRHF